MEKTEISVIIPVYNAEKYIRKCLESLSTQSYRNFEILCIDDGSRDRSSSICREFMEQDGRIRVIEQENSGPSAARNRGIEEAVGRYIAFVDADDRVESEYLEKLFKKMEEGYDLAACGYRDFSRYGVLDLNDFFKSGGNLGRDEFLEDIFTGVGGSLWGKMFRREVILERKLRLNPEIFMCEDQLFVLEYTLLSDKFGAVRECLYNYNRLNEKSLSARIGMDYYKNFKGYIACLERILERYQVEEGKSRKIVRDEIEKLLLNVLRGTYMKKIGCQEKFQTLKSLREDELLKKNLDFRGSLIKNLKRGNYPSVHLMLSSERCMGRIKDFIKFKILRRKDEGAQAFFGSE